MEGQVSHELANVYQFPEQPEPIKMTPKEKLLAPSADVFDLGTYRKRKIKEIVTWEPDPAA